MIKYLIKCHKCDFKQEVTIGGGLGVTEGYYIVVGCQECGKLYTIDVYASKEQEKLRKRECKHCGGKIVVYNNEIEKKAQNHEPTDTNHFCPKCKTNSLEFKYLKTTIN